MSEETARSQVRFSEKIDPDDLPPELVSVDDIKTYFGITDTTLDIPLLASSAIVTAVLRSYTQRALSLGTYIETYTDVHERKPERYLIETPVQDLGPGSDGTLMNKKTGRIWMVAGQKRVVTYAGGYNPIPMDLMAVYMELIRQQMALMGHDQIGTAPPVSALTERSVTVGALRVDYAAGANSQAVTSSGRGAITKEALAPYADILLQYCARTSLVAT